mmetsp:Transcript_45351/g.119833  ORF Transcript_45351/g.119833 Transcript_45351/m.119833 type:complete len:235 (-) Transcript_45351:70-774(-)
MQQKLHGHWLQCCIQGLRVRREVGDQCRGSCERVPRKERRGGIPPCLVADRPLGALDRLACQHLRAWLQVPQQTLLDLRVDRHPPAAREDHVVDAVLVRPAEEEVAGHEVDRLLVERPVGRAREPDVPPGAGVAVYEVALLALVPRVVRRDELVALFALRGRLAHHPHLSDNPRRHHMAIRAMHEAPYSRLAQAGGARRRPLCLADLKLVVFTQRAHVVDAHLLELRPARQTRI